MIASLIRQLTSLDVTPLRVSIHTSDWKTEKGRKLFWSYALWWVTYLRLKGGLWTMFGSAVSCYIGHRYWNKCVSQTNNEVIRVEVWSCIIPSCSRYVSGCSIIYSIEHVKGTLDCVHERYAHIYLWIYGSREDKYANRLTLKHWQI